jgi:hypothetical protein
MFADELTRGVSLRNEGLWKSIVSMSKRLLPLPPRPLLGVEGVLISTCEAPRPTALLASIAMYANMAELKDQLRTSAASSNSSRSAGSRRNSACQGASRRGTSHRGACCWHRGGASRCWNDPTAATLGSARSFRNGREFCLQRPCLLELLRSERHLEKVY